MYLTLIESLNVLQIPVSHVVLKEMKEKRDLIIGTNNTLKWLYIGTETGVTVTYPSTRDDKSCSEYDPRLRYLCVTVGITCNSKYARSKTSYQNFELHQSKQEFVLYITGDVTGDRCLENILN